MSSHANLPFHLYVNVDNKYLGQNMPNGVTAGIWHAANSKKSQVLACHVLLESGAHWSGLPLHALSLTENFSMPYEHVMPWACMGEHLETFHIEYLEGLRCRISTPFCGEGRHTGIMVDWTDGFSRYPQEHKPLNLIAVDSGQFALLPNNYVLYEDKHFVSPASQENMKHYRRGDKVYWEQ
jgi:hypothetical protein